MADITPNAIEKWSEWLAKQPKCESLRPSSARSIAVCLLKEQEMEQDPALQRLITPFCQRIAEYHTYTFTKAAAICMELIITTPISGIVYANFLQWYAYKEGVKRITMLHIAELFRQSTFTKAVINKAWERQKINRYGGVTDNLLDHPEAMESIKDIKNHETQVQNDR